MKVIISSLFFYNDELCIKFLHSLKSGLEHYLLNSTNSLVLILSNNAADNNLDEIEKTIANFDLYHRNFELKFIQNDFNRGFGGGHNHVFYNHDSDIFIVLNNDVFFKTVDWLSKLLKPFHCDDEVAIVGLSTASTVLNQDGYGTPSVNDEEYEIAEGSILALRSEIIKQHGCFAKDFPYAYFEDADLSLRYRLLGYKIGYVDIPHDHLRYASTFNIPSQILFSILEYNRARFYARWGQYLMHRKLKNKIYVDMMNCGETFSILTIPSIFKLLEENRNTTIHVKTRFPEILTVFESKRLDTVTEDDNIVHVRDNEYDRIIKLDSVDFTSTTYTARLIAVAFGVDFDDTIVKKKVSQLDYTDVPRNLQVMEENKKIAVIDTSTNSNYSDGTKIKADRILKSIDELNKQNYATVLVGHNLDDDDYQQFVAACSCDLYNRLSLREKIGLLQRAHIFYGTENITFHLAQLLQVKSFVILGAVLPSARVMNFKYTFAAMNYALDCLGCYHKHFSGIPEFSYCIRRDNACMRNIRTNTITESLRMFLSGNFNINPKIIELQQKMEEKKIEYDYRITRLNKNQAIINIQNDRLEKQNRLIKSYENCSNNLILNLSFLTKWFKNYLASMYRSLKKHLNASFSQKPMG